MKSRPETQAVPQMPTSPAQPAGLTAAAFAGLCLLAALLVVPWPGLPAPVGALVLLLVIAEFLPAIHRASRTKAPAWRPSAHVPSAHVMSAQAGIQPSNTRVTHRCGPSQPQQHAPSFCAIPSRPQSSAEQTSRNGRPRPIIFAVATGHERPDTPRSDALSPSSLGQASRSPRATCSLPHRSMIPSLHRPHAP